MEKFDRASFENMTAKLNDSTGSKDKETELKLGREKYEAMKQRHNKEEEDFINSANGVAISENAELKNFINNAHQEALYINAENAEQILSAFKKSLSEDDSLSKNSLAQALMSTSSEDQSIIIDYIVGRYSSAWLLDFCINRKYNNELAKKSVSQLKMEISQTAGEYKNEIIDKLNQQLKNIGSVQLDLEDVNKAIFEHNSATRN